MESKCEIHTYKKVFEHLPLRYYIHPLQQLLCSIQHCGLKNDLRLDISLEKYIDKLLRISFNSRRKMLRNTLNSILSNEEINELSESSKVCFNLRPQDISIDQWIKLAENCIKIKK